MRVGHRQRTRRPDGEANPRIGDLLGRGGEEIRGWINPEEFPRVDQVENGLSQRLVLQPTSHHARPGGHPPSHARMASATGPLQRPM
jgi:hypothetical protein